MPINVDVYAARPLPQLRAYWRHVERLPCARCGGQIDYDGPTYVQVWVDGRLKRKGNPFALDVGHKVEADLDKRKWYAPIDTQPEHARCNRKAGAQYGNRKRGRESMQRKAFRVTLRTSQRWGKR